VEIIWLVLELKMSNFTDVVQEENQRPMKDQVITITSELI